MYHTKMNTNPTSTAYKATWLRNFAKPFNGLLMSLFKCHSICDFRSFSCILVRVQKDWDHFYVIKSHV